jgi:hypothetical protein
VIGRATLEECTPRLSRLAPARHAAVILVGPHAWRFRTVVWARRRPWGFPGRARPSSFLAVAHGFLALISGRSRRCCCCCCGGGGGGGGVLSSVPGTREQAWKKVYCVKQAVALAACLGADSGWLRRCADSVDSQTPGRLLCRVGLTTQTGQTGQLPPRSRNRSKLVECMCAGIADRAARNSATRRNERHISQNMGVPSRWLSRR